mgnify:CR=1 FL=1
MNIWFLVADAARARIFHTTGKNVALTKKVVEYAHSFDVTVEGELGVLAGIEDDVQAEKSTYTKPEEVEDFVKKTGVDSLAISIGTSHGAFKFKLKEGEEAPPLRFDILEEIEKRIPGFPIVLHGASSVVQDYVDLINQYGGKMEGAIGVSEDQLRRAARLDLEDADPLEENAYKVDLLETAVSRAGLALLD